MYKKSDNLTIDCDNLLWDDSEQTMSTDGTVHLVYKDGTELTAEGFTAMLETNTYEFRKITQGVFTEE